MALFWTTKAEFFRYPPPFCVTLALSWLLEPYQLVTRWHCTIHLSRRRIRSFVTWIGAPLFFLGFVRIYFKFLRSILFLPCSGSSKAVSECMLSIIPCRSGLSLPCVHSSRMRMHSETMTPERRQDICLSFSMQVEIMMRAEKAKLCAHDEIHGH